MRLYLETRNPLALDSPDYIKPKATMRDNSANRKFNTKLLQIVDARPLSVLDLGCAGGGMVQTFVEDGHIAVGIEGSDYSRRHKRAAWAVIPDNLFTADIAKPFTVHAGDSLPYQFDVVTAWEFFEHIRRNDMRVVIDNVIRHLKPGGLLIGSINTVGYSTVVYHQTVENRKYWIDLLAENKFVLRQDLYDAINPDWVRAPVHSFCVVMQLPKETNNECSSIRTLPTETPCNSRQPS